MPRKPAVPPETLFEVLKDLEIFNEKGELKKQKDDIWTEAHTKLGGAITVKNIYTVTIEDRHKLQSKVRSYKKQQQSRLSTDDIDQQVNVESKQDDNVIVPTDTLKAINQLKLDASLNPMIKVISASPFFIFYWFPDQRDLFKDVHMILKTLIIMAKFDGIIENGYIADRCTGDLVSYVFFSHYEKHIIPLAQCVTANSALNVFDFFIGEFLRENVPIPKYILVEADGDMIQTTNSVFNELTFDQYISDGLDFMKHEKNKFCRTTIKIDAIPVLKYVKDLLSRHFELDSIKNFFLLSFIHVSTLPDFDSMKEASDRILIMLISGYMCQLTTKTREDCLLCINVPLVSSLHLIFNDITRQERPYTQNSITDFNNFMKTNFSNKLHKYLTDQAKKFLAQFDPSVDPKLRANPYQKKKIVNEVIQILSVFPVWTDVMPYCSVGAQFTHFDLRIQYFNSFFSFLNENQNTPLNVPVEIFIEKHASLLSSCFTQIRHIVALVKSDTSHGQHGANEEDHYCSYLNFIENWMDRGSKLILQKEEQQLDEECNLHEFDENQEKLDTYLKETDEDCQVHENATKSDGHSDTISGISAIELDHSYAGVDKNNSDGNACEAPTKEFKHSTPEDKRHGSVEPTFS